MRALVRFRNHTEYSGNWWLIVQVYSDLDAWTTCASRLEIDG